jgi:glycosyltransferase involved in cell wall biosynthesis
LEWIIVDDGNEDLKDLFINLKNINYIQIKNKNKDELISIGEKRNICVENSKYDFIVCMDDDDYYPPESILARIKTLIKYPESGCVGCNSVGVYDFILNKRNGFYCEVGAYDGGVSIQKHFT